MEDTIAKIEQMCKICRETNAGDDQYILTRLGDLETLIDLAKKGLVFTEMITTWAKMTKDEKDKAETEQKAQESEAKWIYGEDETGVDGWLCSECGFFEPWYYEFTDDIDFIRFYGHCPSCGRKMTSYTGKPTQNGR